MLGRITSGGKYLLSASGGDVQALVYFSGAFADSALSFGTGHTAASVETAWRAAQAPLFVVDRTAL